MAGIFLTLGFVVPMMANLLPIFPMLGLMYLVLWTYERQNNAGGREANLQAEPERNRWQVIAAAGSTIVLAMATWALGRLLQVW